jgi:GH24 family phage-related lysozyme (muramidase)
MKISQAAFDLIWQEETGGKSYYLSTPERSCDWPGGASGVTIGGFYDLGYCTLDEFRRDWNDKLPTSMLNELEGVIGITGRVAQSHAVELRAIDVPYETAMDVFTNREIPKWEAVVSRLPNADKLSPDCFGALVSLAMNRGDGFNMSRRPSDSRDRYREMRLIKQDMEAQRFAQIPSLFRSMQRLWPTGGDLWKRREHEATLFEKGLSNA